jgi:hypothetical protein
MNRISPHRLELEAWSQTRFVPAQAYAVPTPAAIEAWERAQDRTEGHWIGPGIVRASVCAAERAAAEARRPI